MPEAHWLGLPTGYRWSWEPWPEHERVEILHALRRDEERAEYRVDCKRGDKCRCREKRDARAPGLL